MSHEKVAAVFDEWAQNGRDAKMEEGHGDVVRKVLAAMAVGAGEKILDLGCGNGWATRLLAQSNAGVQAIGIDVAPQMIVRADELHSYTIRARYDLGKFEELEFKDGEFTRVFSMEALYYASDLEKSLAETVRVLKSGGKIDVVVDHHVGNEASHDWSERMELAMCLMSAEEWQAAFEKAGYTNVTTTILEGGVHATESEDPDAKPWGGSLWIHGEKPA
ncbi:MAG: ubiquinone/menaquinone biosynthesis C-methylase UbiE [Planctomycetota bacterium]|jgi:ubiquinone/menaquinone biosynthesis C-methylase UbiE